MAGSTARSFSPDDETEEVPLLHDPFSPRLRDAPLSLLPDDEPTVEVDADEEPTVPGLSERRGWPWAWFEARF